MKYVAIFIAFFVLTFAALVYITWEDDTCRVGSPLRMTPVCGHVNGGKP